MTEEEREAFRTIFSAIRSLCGGNATQIDTVKLDKAMLVITPDLFGPPVHKEVS